VSGQVNSCLVTTLEMIRSAVNREAAVLSGRQHYFDQPDSAMRSAYSAAP